MIAVAQVRGFPGEPFAKPVAIYFLRDPRTYQIRYVGQSVDPEFRYTRHLRCDGVTHRDNWVRQLRALGLRPVLQVVEWLVPDLANEAEIHWIATLRRTHDLVNSTTGGEGLRGYRHTAAAKAAMAEKHVGNLNALGNDPESFRTRRLGKRMSEEAKRRIGVSSRERAVARWRDDPEGWKKKDRNGS